MTCIIRSILVPYSVEQMFTLVNDINAYPEFIPECTASRVLIQEGNKLTAEMNLSKSGISKSFITCNVISKNKSIVMRLVEGPFSYFSGDWRFIALDKKMSRVELYLDFGFENKFIELSFGCLFKEIVNSIVTKFIRRAEEIYRT